MTSATFTLSEEHLAKNPREGALLNAESGTTGLKDYRFQGVL